MSQLMSIFGNSMAAFRITLRPPSHPTSSPPE
jgi:hypothetical protein